MVRPTCLDAGHAANPERMESIMAEGIRSGEIHRSVSGRKLANLIIASLEDALMIARLERNDQALPDAREHLHAYIEAEVRNTKLDDKHKDRRRI